MGDVLIFERLCSYGFVLRMKGAECNADAVSANNV